MNGFEIENIFDETIRPIEALSEILRGLCCADSIEGNEEYFNLCEFNRIFDLC